MISLPNAGYLPSRGGGTSSACRRWSTEARAPGRLPPCTNTGWRLPTPGRSEIDVC
ncbi:hypothetical protein DPMN_012842 [Dreissena polymorpha]|uniref:Uncharacterized protein n=1 Tax=Dreissena polymorpha TaxID=45954 RepID=A0A9D4N368_DREPO|nr:hypothetical protein DPMN_012842 [Dreissena polymorpha]